MCVIYLKRFYQCNQVRAGRGTQERAALARGSATFSASPVPISLVTFLFGDKKVTRPFFEQKIDLRG